MRLKRPHSWKNRRYAEKVKEANDAAVAAAAKAEGKAKAKKGRKKGGEFHHDSVVKQARRYPPKIELDHASTFEGIIQYLPQGCRLSRDHCDNAWRICYFGAQYTRSWNKYGIQGAGIEIARQAWKHALKFAYELEVPFGGLKSEGASGAASSGSGW